MATPFETMQEHYRQRDLAAREWQKKGGQVIGYFCDSVPEELILAAGFFPLRISGDPEGSTAEIDKYVEPFHEGFVRSQLDMLLTGKYDYLDFIVVPRARDSIAQQYSHLRQITKLYPEIKLPEMYLYEFIHTRSYNSAFYNLDRLRDLKKKLEEWAGKKITNQALKKAIAITNENRRLLKEVAALRAAEPPRISGVEALQIIGSAMFMLKAEHNKLLKEFLEGAAKLPARNGARLFVEGSPLDNLQFYKAVESDKVTIVAEDNCWGNRYSDNLIDTSRDPVEAIASRYHNKSPCPYVVFPVELRAEYCRDKALEAKAQGVVFYVLDWDPPGIWDYPGQKAALDKAGIPTICFMPQPYRLTDAKSMKNSIENFVRTI